MYIYIRMSAIKSIDGKSKTVTATSQASLLGLTNTWTGTNFFNTTTKFPHILPTSDVAPTSVSHLVNKRYVDDLCKFKQIAFGSSQTTSLIITKVLFTKPFSIPPIVILTVLINKTDYLSYTSNLVEVTTGGFSYILESIATSTNIANSNISTVSWIALL
jgi:hypothetical protein